MSYMMFVLLSNFLLSVLRLVTGQDGFQIYLALMIVTLVKLAMKTMNPNVNHPSNLSNSLML